MRRSAIATRRVFVDSSAYLALLDQRDANHAVAVEIVRRLGEQRFRQFTTNVLCIEAHALLLSSLGIAPSSAFLREIAASNTVIIRVRQQDEERATQLIFAYADKDFSLTDAISFIVMERLRMRYAFTFDRHFQQYGFLQLAPELL